VGSDLFGQEALAGVSGIAAQMAGWKFASRSREQVARFFAGMDLVEPGLVRAEEWRPGPGAGAAGRSTVWGAVARKR
jgi:hypothetical protein